MYWQGDDLSVASWTILVHPSTSFSPHNQQKHATCTHHGPSTGATPPANWVPQFDWVVIMLVYVRPPIQHAKQPQYIVQPNCQAIVSVIPCSCAGQWSAVIAAEPVDGPACPACTQGGRLCSEQACRAADTFAASACVLGQAETAGMQAD